MFVHGGYSMNIMYGLKKIGRFICAMRMFCGLCVRFMCVSRHCVDITWTLNGLMGEWRMFYGLYGGFLCHKDILWTFVYFKSVLWIVCWINFCLRVLYVDWCTWRMSCWYFGCFADCILDYIIVWKCLVHLYMIYVYALHVGPLLKFCKIFWINLLFFSRWEYHDMFGHWL
jgi:hypothetical protein